MNSFLDLAARQISAPVKARQRATEKRTLRKAEQKALAERDALFREWKRQQREHIDKLVAGPHGEAARGLLAFLDVLSLDQANALVKLVKTGPWRDADSGTRFEIVSIIGATIVALRERHGLVPFDDPLPPHLNAFLVIREWLR